MAGRLEGATPLVKRAYMLAYSAHEGQVDKAGVAYIEHPLAVALSLASDDEEGRVVALLHDVVEDTSVTYQDLVDWGIPYRCVRAVEALTRFDTSNTPGIRHVEPVEAYYARVAADPLALRVKLADIAHNASPERLQALDEATRDRLERKYTKALNLLLGPS